MIQYPWAQLGEAENLSGDAENLWPLGRRDVNFADFGTRELPFMSLAPAGHVLGTQHVKITLSSGEYRAACALQLRKVLEHADRLLPETWYGAVAKHASSYVVYSKVVSGHDWLPGSNS